MFNSMLRMNSNRWILFNLIEKPSIIVIRILEKEIFGKFKHQHLILEAVTTISSLKLNAITMILWNETLTGIGGTH